MGWFVPALIAGASAVAGALGNRSKKYTSESQMDQTTTQEGSGTNEVAPVYSDEVAGLLKNPLLAAYSNRLREGTSPFMDAYRAQGLRSINQGASARQRILQNLYASRGLQWSPAAATAEAGSEANRVGNIINFQTGLPLIEEELRSNRLGEASRFLASLPIGQRSSYSQRATGRTTGTQTGTQTMPGNMLGGAFGGAAGSLALLYGMGAFNGGQTPSYGPANVQATGMPPVSSLPTFGMGHSNPANYPRP